jgi:hypothetical protein
MVTGVAALPNGVIVAARDDEPVVISRDAGSSWELLLIDGQQLHRGPAGGVQATWDGRMYVRSVLYGSPDRPVFAWSHDAGVTWSAFLGQRSYVEVPQVFAVDPSEANVLYRSTVSGGPGVERSEDGGASFQPWGTTPAAVQALRLSGDGAQFWAMLRGSQLALSLDRGRTWEILGPTPVPLLGGSITVLPWLAATVFAVDLNGYVWVYWDVASSDL